MLIQRKIVCFDAVSRNILFWNWTEFRDRLILRSVDVSVGESKQSEKKREYLRENQIMAISVQEVIAFRLLVITKKQISTKTGKRIFKSDSIAQK